MLLLLYLFGLLYVCPSSTFVNKNRQDVSSIESSLLSASNYKASQVDHLIRENRVKREYKICDVMKSGTFGDPMDQCKTYYSCTENEPIKYECPKDLRYNNQISVCDIPNQVDYMCNSKHPATWFTYANEDNWDNSEYPLSETEDNVDVDDDNSNNEVTKPPLRRKVLHQYNNQFMQPQTFNENMVNPYYPTIPYQVTASLNKFVNNNLNNANEQQRMALNPRQFLNQ